MDTSNGKIYTPEQMKDFFGIDVKEKPEYEHPFKRMKVDPTPAQMKRDPPKVEPYEPCPCGSGKKFKFCCFRIKTEE